MTGSLRNTRMLATILVLVFIMGTFGGLKVEAQRRYSGHNYHRRHHRSGAKGALIGGAVGLAGGALLGGGKGALIGAGAGAGTGYLIQRHRIRSRHRHYYGRRYWRH